MQAALLAGRPAAGSRQTGTSPSVPLAGAGPLALPVLAALGLPGAVLFGSPSTRATGVRGLAQLEGPAAGEQTYAAAWQASWPPTPFSSAALRAPLKCLAHTLSCSVCLVWGECLHRVCRLQCASPGSTLLSSGTDCASDLLMGSRAALRFLWCQPCLAAFMRVRQASTASRDYAASSYDRQHARAPALV